MNIFVLNEDPVICAQLHCDKHVVKMPLETAQMLCTAIHIHTKGQVLTPYKPTHTGHPCVIWTSRSIENFLWLADLGLQLCFEYTYRYGKEHKSQEVIQWCLMNCPRFPHIPLTKRPLCVPKECNQDDLPVQSYINYYIIKAETVKMVYTNREVPEWLQ